MIICLSYYSPKRTVMVYKDFPLNSSRVNPVIVSHLCDDSKAYLGIWI